MKAFIQITKILFLLLGLIIGSCKTQKKTENTKPLVNDESGRLDFKSGRVLSNKMKQNEFKYTYLTTKFSVTADIDSQVNSFDVTLRAKKNSVIWISISPALGIEAARVLITTDSVKFMNKLNKTYFKGDYAYISKLFNTELDFDMLESLLIGNSVNFYDEDEKLKSSKDEGKYMLSTIKKRKLRKALERNEPVNELIQRIWLIDNTFKISKITINDLSTNRTFEALYENFQSVDSLSFPYSVKFNITAQKNVKIKLNYNKVSQGKPESFPFNIPAKYDPIQK